MEQGKKLRNEDRISQLPEPLILQILSSLETKQAVATSVLSKQWRHVWKLVPKLKFDDDVIRSETFSEIVCKVLLSHKAPVLESLDLEFNVEDCGAMAIGMWIGIAYARHLRKLLITAGSDERDLAFPSCLYNCETLETLILRGWVLIDVRSPVCLKSLTTLYLESVEFKDEASVLNLLSGCPNLQNLALKRGEKLVPKVFTIAIPSLQRLTVSDRYEPYGQQEAGGFVINAPSLKFLKVEGYKGLQFRLIEIASELVEANITHVNIAINEKLLGSLTSVQRLSLALSPSKLVYLELSSRLVEWRKLLLLMLDCSPKLQVLKLSDKVHWGEEHGAYEKWNQPKSVSECLVHHLETFVWNDYKEQFQEVAKFILRNANRFKRATFSVKDLNSDERLDMLEELESVVSASESSCKLLILSQETLPRNGFYEFI